MGVQYVSMFGIREFCILIFQVSTENSDYLVSGIKITRHSLGKINYYITVYLSVALK